MPKAPTKEIGQASLGQTLPGWRSFSSAIDEREYAPDVRYPKSVETYERMETDAQVAGLELGMFLPIRRFDWFINPNSASDQTVEDCARDFNLPIRGEEAAPSAGRDRNRFSHDRHLAHTLRSPGVYGHYFFEQFGEIVDGKWRMRKLAPRPPYTIAKGGGIQVAPDGGLESIKQGFGLVQKVIPVNRLVAYVWEQEAANWFGRSLLRPCFKNWTLKDRLLRVDAMRHERNSMGVPWFETGPDLSQEQVNALAETAEMVRAGEKSGGAGPGKLSMKGVDGSLSDVLASIRYHDQQMSMAMLEMFTDLGRNSETGSRALGESFIDFFAYAQETIADWHAKITTEHAIWDWVDWNYGGDEGAPELIWERREEREASVSDLATLIDKEAIVVDDAVRGYVRQRFNFPPPSEDQTPQTSPPAPTPAVEAKAGERRRRTAVAASTSLSLPERELRRQPYEQEVAASVDYALMDAQMQTLVDSLVADVSTLQAGQIDELTAAIEAADGDLVGISDINASAAFKDTIDKAMQTMATQGVEQAIGEAARQGVTAAVPEIDTAILTARAEAVDTLLTRSLSEAAGRKALSLTGGALSSSEVAFLTAEHLGGLSDDYLRQQLGGTLVQAMNTGRKAVFAETPPKLIYSSELLDESACEECVAIDGTEYETLEEAEADYPTGGFSSCLGGPRCRGTLVAVYANEGDASVG